MLGTIPASMYMSAPDALKWFLSFFVGNYFYFWIKYYGNIVLEYGARLSQARSQATLFSPTTALYLEAEALVELQTWMEVVGGKKNGRIYGVGNLTSNYRRGTSSFITQQSRALSSRRCHWQEFTEIVEMRHRLAAHKERYQQLFDVVADGAKLERRMKQNKEIMAVQ